MKYIIGVPLAAIAVLCGIRSLGRRWYRWTLTGWEDDVQGGS